MVGIGNQSTGSQGDGLQGEVAYGINVHDVNIGASSSLIRIENNTNVDIDEPSTITGFIVEQQTDMNNPAVMQIGSSTKAVTV